jgi:hypothetical protein
MGISSYHFITHWRMNANCWEISDILGDAEGLARWCSAVYLEVKIIKPGDAKGVGKVVDLYTKGRLPYRLRWKFRVVENNEPYGFVIEAFGDFVGRGIWTFEQDGEWVNIRYDWDIIAEKPLLKILSWLLKPIFSWNHHWAMNQAEQYLQSEILRRRGSAV